MSDKFNKELRDLIKIEWKSLDEVRDDIFREIKNERKKNKNRR